MNSFSSISYRFRWLLARISFFRLGTFRAAIRSTLHKPRAVIFPSLALIWPFSALFPDVKQTSESLVANLFARAQTATRARDFDLAERLLHKILQHLHICHSQGILNATEFAGKRVRVYSELASVALMQEKWSKAERLIQDAIRDSHRLLNVSIDDPMVLEFSLKLALIYQRLGRNEEASHGFVYCLKTLEGKPVPDQSEERANRTALLGMCHNSYSKFLYETGSLEAALNHAKSAQQLALQLYPPDHSNCVNLTIDMAVILAGLQRYSEARSLLEDAATRLRAQKQSLMCHVLLQRLTLELMDGQLASARVFAAQLSDRLARGEGDKTIREQFNRLKKSYDLKQIRG